MVLILASSSPRRKALLRRAGIRFRALASRVEPPPGRGELAERYVRRAALAKALEVAARSPRGALVLGADTVVVDDGRILGKPAGPADAARMLRRLSGRTHRVVTGVCLVVAPRRRRALFHETTRVRFRRLRDAEIRAYVRGGEPLGKAGAYAIQAGAAKFVTRLEGGYSNVMGLPVARLCQVLERLGYLP
jgi:nucleoside triphosphate pyrophosphatase